MESIEKLRDWAADEHTVYRGLSMETFTGKLTAYEFAKLDAIVGNLESEIAEKYTLLPVDADDIPIHVGDKTNIGIVSRIKFEPDTCYVEAYNNGTIQCFEASKLHHVKPRTLRDILFDFMRDCCTSELGNSELVEKYEVELRELLSGDAE